MLFCNYLWFVYKDLLDCRGPVRGRTKIKSEEHKVHQISFFSIIALSFIQRSFQYEFLGK